MVHQNEKGWKELIKLRCTNPLFRFSLIPGTQQLLQTQAIHVQTNNQCKNIAQEAPCKCIQATLHSASCTANYTTTVAHLELSLSNIICSINKMGSSINKMGRLHRMLILKACPYQQILSSKGTETTNGTTSQHHPYQQICWSTRWVDRSDCSFWPPFDISCHPETTKWVAHPICKEGWCWSVHIS